MGIPSPIKPSRFISPTRARQIQRTLNNLKLTVLCGFLTILVLRGTLGAGKFGTPAKDFEEIKLQFERVHVHRKQLASRVLTEAIEQKQKQKLTVFQESNEEDDDSNESFDPSKPYILGPKISDWDSKRQSLLLQENSTDEEIVMMNMKKKDKPSMMLITGSQPSSCENPLGDHFLLKSIKNKVDYCRLHDIEIFYNMAHLDAQLSGFWAKLPLIRKMMLKHPEIEWFWWMDSDAMFTDMAFEVPMEKYKDYNMVLHGWDDMVYNQKKWVGLNTGSFLIRNCQWSLDLLDAWAPMGPQGKVRNEAGKMLSSRLTGRPDFEADDQSALVYLLVAQKEKWADKVHLENSYYLHGYWSILVDKYEEMMEKYHNGLGDDRWPFVTHFVGCKPCKKVGDYNAELCFKQMERAFNFADNQVLELYGYQHKSLSASKVRRVANIDEEISKTPLIEDKMLETTSKTEDVGGVDSSANASTTQALV